MEVSISISEARENLSELVNQVAFGKKRYILSRRGKQLAALVPIEDDDDQALDGNKAIKQ